MSIQRQGDKTCIFLVHMKHLVVFIIIPDKPQITIFKAGRSSIIYVVDRQGRL